MGSPPLDLTAILDDSALVGLEAQVHLAEVLGEHRWAADLEAGTVTFTGEQTYECRAHLLGTAAPGPGSWLWSWANPGGFPAEVTALAATVRDFGEQNGIRELAEGEVPLASLPDGRRDPLGAVATFIGAATVITGRWTSYNGEAGAGTRAAFVVEHPAFALPAVSGPRTVRVLTQGIAELPIADHRRAVAGYAQFRPIAAQWSPAGDAVHLTGPDFTVDITFDAQGRLDRLTSSMGG